MPNTRRPTRVATRCSIRSGPRVSVKQAAKLPTRPIARSVAPNSNAPASEVLAPPSKPATHGTARDGQRVELDRTALHPHRGPLRAFRQRKAGMSCSDPHMHKLRGSKANCRSRPASSSTIRTPTEYSNTMPCGPSK